MNGRMYFALAAIVVLCGTVAAEDLGPVIVVTGEPGAQQFPDVAYGNDEYLVVWEVQEDFERNEVFDVYGRMLDASGQPKGDPFPIFADAILDEQAPEVAYSPVDDRYLVVMRDRASSEAFGQLVANGQLVGGPFSVGMSHGPTFFGPADRARVVSVAYKANGNEWFIGITPNENAGIDFADNAGEPIGYALTGLGSGTNPSVAWSSRSDVGIIVYEDRRVRNTGTENLAATLITGDSFLVNDEPIMVRDQDFAEESPRVAYNEDDDQFLVVWDERIGYAEGHNSSTDTIGQIIAADGSFVGDPIPIEASIPYTLRQDVAYSSAAGVYLVVWKGEDNNDFEYADVFGRFVARDGSLIGERFTIFDGGDDDTDDGTGERYNDESKLPVVTANDDGSFLVVWEEAGTNRNPEDRDIQARFVSMADAGVDSWSLFE